MQILKKYEASTRKMVDREPEDYRASMCAREKEGETLSDIKRMPVAPFNTP